MSPAGLLAYLAGLLVLFFSSASRASLPSLLAERGRDPSDRRKLAAFHLLVDWLARSLALLACGAGLVLLTGSFPLPVWALLVSLSLVVLLVGQVLPSWLGHTHPDRMAGICRPYSLLAGMLFGVPVRLLFGERDGQESSADEWLAVPPDFLWLEQRREKGDQDDYDQEQELIDSIVDFSDKMVREVMVPRIDMICVELKDDLLDVAREVERAGHSRLPVYREKIDEIVGILHAKDLLSALAEGGSQQIGMKDILREPYFVPEYKRIDNLFRELQSHRIHMAIVVDEYGGTAGLVTIEDIVEEVFGEIQDEFDAESPLIQSLGRGAFRIDARLPLDDLNDLLGSSFDSMDFETLGGMVYRAFSKIPKPGESVELSGYRFTVEKVRRQRVLLVKVAPVAAGPRDGGYPEQH
ncbi:HlyC/CorC family transporter [Candidatus Fermentibacterales bacterium]|nr:HlyC/CorC family transporter [Candidatus Fermentibacterales bacterium]